VSVCVNLGSSALSLEFLVKIAKGQMQVHG